MEPSAVPEVLVLWPTLRATPLAPAHRQHTASLATPMVPSAEAAAMAPRALLRQAVRRAHGVAAAVRAATIRVAHAALVAASAPEAAAAARAALAAAAASVAVALVVAVVRVAAVLAVADTN